MTTSGRLMDRIAMLRKDIMQGVGIEVLNSAYEILENEEDGDTEVRNTIILILLVIGKAE